MQHERGVRTAPAQSPERAPVTGRCLRATRGLDLDVGVTVQRLPNRILHRFVPPWRLPGCTRPSIATVAPRAPRAPPECPTCCERPKAPTATSTASSSRCGAAVRAASRFAPAGASRVHARCHALRARPRHLPRPRPHPHAVQTLRFQHATERYMDVLEPVLRAPLPRVWTTVECARMIWMGASARAAAPSSVVHAHRAPWTTARHSHQAHASHTSFATPPPTPALPKGRPRRAHPRARLSRPRPHGGDEMGRGARGRGIPAAEEQSRARAINTTCPPHVRLSTHPSNTCLPSAPPARSRILPGQVGGDAAFGALDEARRDVAASIMKDVLTPIDAWRESLRAVQVRAGVCVCARAPRRRARSQAWAVAAGLPGACTHHPAAPLRANPAPAANTLPPPHKARVPQLQKLQAEVDRRWESLHVRTHPLFNRKNDG